MLVEAGEELVALALALPVLARDQLLGVQGLGFRVQGSGFRVGGLGVVARDDLLLGLLVLLPLGVARRNHLPPAITGY